MKHSQTLFRKGDTFQVKPNQFYVFYNDIILTWEDHIDFWLDLVNHANVRTNWAHFAGTASSDALYYKIAKPTFVFKERFSWSPQGMSDLLEAKFKGSNRKVTYMGVVSDDLTKLRAMTEGYGQTLTPIGNEILWRSVLQLTDQKFETI